MTKPATEDSHQANTEKQPATKKPAPQFKMNKRVETKEDGRILIYYEFVPLNDSNSSVE